MSALGVHVEQGSADEDSILVVMETAGTDTVGVHGSSLGERPVLGEERKERDEGGGVGGVVVLHEEEASDGVAVLAMERVASEHSVPGDDIPGGHAAEDGGGVPEGGALGVDVDEGGGYEEVGVEAGARGVAVDGAGGAEVEERGAGLENEGKGVVVGLREAAAAQGAVEAESEGGPAEGVGADESVVVMDARGGDLVEQVAGEGEVATRHGRRTQ